MRSRTPARLSSRPRLRSSSTATLVTVGHQSVHQRRADEAGSTRHERSHRLTIPMAAVRSDSDRTSRREMNWVARTAAALIAVQLVIRAVLAFSGYFYWDDLILIGRAGAQDLLSAGYLFDDHDGHVMPAAFLVAGGITRLAPLEWIAPAISLIVLQLLASLALLRALHVILGWRPVLLVPLTFALFTPAGRPRRSRGGPPR